MVYQFLYYRHTFGKPAVPVGEVKGKYVNIPGRGKYFIATGLELFTANCTGLGYKVPDPPKVITWQNRKTHVGFYLAGKLEPKDSALFR